MTDQPDSATKGRAGAFVLIVLSLSMFIYVIDTTIMNVSISALVEDLDTTVDAIQAAVTVYTLTMAAFMLTGGKLGDIWGPRRAFRIGLVIYGIGTVITALAPNVGFVLLGWSILEGLGSALMVPAVNTLVRANYRGARRASAYGVLFGVAAAGAAFGPLIGGWITATYTWRLAFALEAVIVVLVLAASFVIKDAPPIEPRPRLDVVGAVLSVVGLGLFVLGILMTNNLGWLDPLVVAMIVGGLGVLAAFWWWIRGREQRGEPVLLHPSIFRHRSVSAGLPVLSAQTFAQGGILFLVPLFAQLMLGLDAFETGLAILPLSLSVLVTSVATPRLGRYIYPKWIVQVGLLVLFAGGFLLARAMNDATSGGDLAISMAVVGLGMGLIVAQLPNLVLSGVESEEASEASGLTGTAQNLGMALGTAVVGSVILVVTASSFVSGVEESAVFSEEQTATVREAVEEDVRVLTSTEFADAVAAAPEEIAVETAVILEVSARDGFQAAILAGGLIALLGFLVAFRLPKRKIGEVGLEGQVRSGAIPRTHLEAADL